MPPIIWNAEPIRLAAGLDLHVSASAGVVTTGKTVDDVYASDLKLTPEETIEYAEALTVAATFAISARKG